MLMLSFKKTLGLVWSWIRFFILVINLFSIGTRQFYYCGAIDIGILEFTEVLNF
jgi:hypothetical protein